MQSTVPRTQPHIFLVVWLNGFISCSNTSCINNPLLIYIVLIHLQKKRTVSDFRKSDHVYRYTTILLQHTVRLSYPQPCILPGRYGEDFVEKRKEKLQMWSNRIARHPVLSRSEVIAHFYLCDDEGVRECVCVCVCGRREGRVQEELTTYYLFSFRGSRLIISKTDKTLVS